MIGSILDGVKRIVVSDAQSNIELAVITADTATTANAAIVVKLSYEA